MSINNPTSRRGDTVSAGTDVSFETIETRLVPNDFDTYLTTVHARALHDSVTKCEGCWRTDLRCWRLEGPDRNSMTYCEACLRGQHAADTNEEYVVRAILGAAVASALDVCGNVELVRAAVDDAFAQRIRVEVD
jgi:hypothetical protein